MSAARYVYKADSENTLVRPIEPGLLISQTMEEELTCCICFEFYNDPVMLPCSHNFCRKCIMKIMTSQGQKSDCPNCRQPIYRRGYQELSNNKTLANLVDIYRKERFRTMDERKCIMHPNSLLDLFCQTCQKPVCQDCVFEKHGSKHLVDSIDSLIHDEKEKQDELAQSAKDIQVKLNEKCDLLDSKKARIESVVAVDEKYLNTLCEELVQQLKSRIRQLKLERTQNRTQITLEITRFRLQLNQLTTLFTEKDAMKPISNKQIYYKMLRFLNKKFSTFINFSNVSPDSLDNPISESFHNLANLTELRKAIGKLSLVEKPIQPAAWELEVPPHRDQSKKINFSGTSSAFHKVQQNGNVHSQGDTFGRYFNSCTPLDRENVLSDFFTKLLKKNQGDTKDEKVNCDVPNGTSSSAVRSDLQNGMSSPSQMVKRTDEVFEVNQFLSNGHKRFSNNGAAAACKNSSDVYETRDVFDFSEFLKDESNGSFGNFVAASQDGPTIDVTDPPTNGNDRSSENSVAHGGKIDVPANFFQYPESSVNQHVASTSQSASSFVTGNHSTPLPSSSVSMDGIPIFFTAKAAGLGLPTESDKFGKKHKRSSVYGQNKKS